MLGEVNVGRGCGYVSCGKRGRNNCTCDALGGEVEQFGLHGLCNGGEVGLSGEEDSTPQDENPWSTSGNQISHAPKTITLPLLWVRMQEEFNQLHRYVVYRVCMHGAESAKSFHTLPNQYFPQVSSQLPVYVLLGVGQLHVHVVVGGDQVALVLHPPLELHHDGLAREPVQKGLRVQRHGLECSPTRIGG